MRSDTRGRTISRPFSAVSPRSSCGASRGWASGELGRLLTRRPSRVICKNRRDARGKPLGIADVQELIGTMGIGLRAEHAGDYELRVWKSAAEHGHEGNRAPLPLIGRRPSVVSLARGIEGAFEPRSKRRGIPAVIPPRRLEADSGAIGWIPFECLFERRSCLGRIDAGR